MKLRIEPDFNNKSGGTVYPQEQTGPIGKAGFGLSLLGMLLVVICLNWFAGWYLEDHTLNRGYWIITQKGKLLDTLTMPGYWLIVGDSAGNFGVVPEVLDERLGVHTVNLCTVADMLTMDDFFMVEEYVARHGPPAGVLMVHVYDAWPREGELGAFARSNWGLKKISEFSQLDDFGFSRLLIKRYFPLYSESTTLAQMSLIPRTTFFRSGLPFAIKENGAMTVMADPPGVMRNTQAHLHYIKNAVPHISRTNLHGLEALAKIAQQYGFSIYIVNGPLYEGLWEHADFRSFFNMMQQEVKQVVERYPVMHQLPFDKDLLFPASEMENVDHLNVTAAKVYTARLAARIEQER